MIPVTNPGIKPTRSHTVVEPNSGEIGNAKKISSNAIPVLANIPRAKAGEPRENRESQMDRGPPKPAPFVQCMDACDKIPDELIQLACRTACLFAK